MTSRSKNIFDKAFDPTGSPDPALARVQRKLRAGGRFDAEDGLACLETRDLIGLGRMAMDDRTARFGNQTFYVVNHHLNYTNICKNNCRFCAFHRAPGASGGYTLDPAEAAEKIAGSRMEGLREVHIVGGCNPALGLDYYLDLLRSLSRARPGIRLKAFTAVEVDHIARTAGLSWRDTLIALREAGLSAIPGGGAEVFSDRVRARLFPEKIDGRAWLAIHGEAHRLGVPTNATLLFGHMETPEERIRHLLRLRAQQDETGGFQAFIPLPFLPANTGLHHLPGPTGVEILKTLAVSRLILDNIPHIKAYWVMLGIKLTQIAQYFGADDLEGTVVQENIAHQAGAGTAQGLAQSDLKAMIREAGFSPVERDTFHHRAAAS